MKKIICGLLAVFCVITSSVTGFAAEFQSNQESETIPYSNGISLLRYDYISGISMSGSKTSTTASGSASIRVTSASSRTYLYLERSSGGSYSTWVTLDDSKSTTQSSYQVSGSTSGLSSAYSYRLKAVVYCYDASGNLVDSGTAYYQL